MYRRGTEQWGGGDGSKKQSPVCRLQCLLTYPHMISRWWARSATEKIPKRFARFWKINQIVHLKYEIVSHIHIHQHAHADWALSNNNRGSYLQIPKVCFATATLLHIACLNALLYFKIGEGINGGESMLLFRPLLSESTACIVFPGTAYIFPIKKHSTHTRTHNKNKEKKEQWVDDDKVCVYVLSPCSVFLVVVHSFQFLLVFYFFDVLSSSQYNILPVKFAGSSLHEWGKKLYISVGCRKK